VTKLLQCLRDELVRRDYAASSSYVQIIDAFRQHTGARLDRITPAQLRCYHLFLLEERSLAIGTVVTQICALRFFCRYVLHRRDVREDLPYPKERLRLPVVLSPDEVQRLIASAKNLYHRTLTSRDERVLLRLRKLDGNRPGRPAWRAHRCPGFKQLARQADCRTGRCSRRA
jgi:integrase/recombinase XerD